MTDAEGTNDVVAELAGRARDAAYVAVGLGALCLQRAQALRRGRVRDARVEEGTALLRAGVAGGTRQVGEWLGGTCAFVSEQLAPLGADLPGPARQLVEGACRGIEEIGAQLRHLVVPGA
ncbi:MAG: hypothetical protein ACRDXC_05875 [Acidimicrobiales bacterium]